MDSVNVLFLMLQILHLPWLSHGDSSGPGMSQPVIEEILRLHNHYRGTVDPEAANMHPLVSPPGSFSLAMLQNN